MYTIYYVYYKYVHNDFNHATQLMENLTMICVVQFIYNTIYNSSIHIQYTCVDKIEISKNKILTIYFGILLKKHSSYTLISWNDGYVAYIISKRCTLYNHLNNF